MTDALRAPLKGNIVVRHLAQDEAPSLVTSDPEVEYGWRSARAPTAAATPSSALATRAAGL